MLRWIALALCACLSVTAAQAQQDAPTTLPIFYGDFVEGELTQTAFYDWWQVEVSADDQMIVEMTGYDGLEPLVGILDSGGTLVARSADGEPNGIVDIEYTVEAAGTYTIVTTRVGNADGTSAGGYELRLGLGNPRPVRDNPYAEVVFRCGGDEVTTAASLIFPMDAASGEGDALRIVVYGFDGFQPVIRTEVSSDETQNCTREGDGAGDMVTFPGEDPISAQSGEVAVAEATVAKASESHVVTMTVGSAGGAAGRYMAVITGLAIDPADEEEPIEAHLGPLAAQESSLLVYMLRTGNSRLDPSIQFGDGETGCDDAGRRGCEGIPSAAGVGVVTADGLRLVGERFDAGARVPQGSLEALPMVLTSFRGNTSGSYGVLLIGELPRRESDEG